MNYIQRKMLNMTAYACVSLILSFGLPPIGFFMAFHAYKTDKRRGERYAGWITQMIISVLMSIIYITLIIYLCISDTDNLETALLLSKSL